jgi:hypothetical protein
MSYGNVKSSSRNRSSNSTNSGIKMDSYASAPMGAAKGSSFFSGGGGSSGGGFFSSLFGSGSSNNNNNNNSGSSEKRTSKNSAASPPMSPLKTAGFSSAGKDQYRSHTEKAQSSQQSSPPPVSNVKKNYEDICSIDAEFLNEREDITYSPKKKKSFEGFSFSPKKNEDFEGFTYSPKKNEASEQADSKQGGEKPDTTKRPFDRFIVLIKANGAFELNIEFVNTSGLKNELNELIAAIPAILRDSSVIDKNAVWATVIALIVFETTFFGLSQEWETLYNKSKKFINSQLKGHNLVLSQLVEQVKQLLRF